MDPDMPVGVASTRLLVDLGAEFGVPPRRLLQGSAIDPRRLGDPLGEITARQELVVTENLVRERGDVPGLGIEAGRRYHVAMHGFWGFAVLTSRTLREVVRAGMRYLDTIWAFDDITMDCAAGSVVVTYQYSSLPTPIRKFVAERDIAATCVIYRETMGSDFSFSGIGFRHDAPADTARYACFFGIEPEFGAACNTLRYPEAWLDLPMPQANPLVNAGYNLACRKLMAERRSRIGVAGAVRDTLSTRLAEGIPDAAAVASELQMSVRTLTRRLEDEGTSFRTLLDEVRQTIADELLSSVHMPIALIARQLGYHDTGSFSRAFRRWKGISPHEYRAGLHPIAA